MKTSILIKKISILCLILMGLDSCGKKNIDPIDQLDQSSIDEKRTIELTSIKSKKEKIVSESISPVNSSSEEKTDNEPLKKNTKQTNSNKQLERPLKLDSKTNLHIPIKPNTSINPTQQDKSEKKIIKTEVPKFIQPKYINYGGYKTLNDTDKATPFILSIGVGDLEYINATFDFKNNELNIEAKDKGKYVGDSFYLVIRTYDKYGNKLEKYTTKETSVKASSTKTRKFNKLRRRRKIKYFYKTVDVKSILKNPNVKKIELGMVWMWKSCKPLMCYAALFNVYFKLFDKIYEKCK